MSSRLAGFTWRAKGQRRLVSDSQCQTNRPIINYCFPHLFYSQSQLLSIQGFSIQVILYIDEVMLVSYKVGASGNDLD